MLLNGLFGYLSTWALIAVAWALASIIVGLMIGIVSRVGGGEEGGE